MQFHKNVLTLHRVPVPLSLVSLAFAAVSASPGAPFLGHHLFSPLRGSLALVTLYFLEVGLELRSHFLNKQGCCPGFSVITSFLLCSQG